MILLNAVKCQRCGDVLCSEKENDEKTCSCGAITIGGGKEILYRKFADRMDYMDFSIMVGDFIMKEDITNEEGNV